MSWREWIPPAGYEVNKLRDFTQPMPDDGSCALCGKLEEECPCYKYPHEEPHGLRHKNGGEESSHSVTGSNR